MHALIQYSRQNDSLEIHEIYSSIFVGIKYFLNIIVCIAGSLKFN